MVRTATRLFAGSLALALPLAAAAGCGVEKKRTIKQEFSSAQSNLESSKAASFTLRFEDPKGGLEKTFKDGADGTPQKLFDAVLKGSVSFTVDPTSDKTLKQLDLSCGTTDIAKRLKDVNAAISIKDDVSTLTELRLVDGTLYARADFKEIGALAKQGGVDDFDAQFNDFVDSAPAKLRPGLVDARDGKWIKLALASYIDKFVGLAQSFAPGANPDATATPNPCNVDTTKLGGDLFTAVKPSITVTAANDDSKNRVLDVKVDARAAAKAALKVLKSSKELPFGDLFGGVGDSDIDSGIKAGQAHGTITLKSGHLSQVKVDLESIRQLSNDPGTISVAGSSVVIDVNDEASAVEAPTSNVSTFDVGDLVDNLLEGFSQSVGGSDQIEG